MALIKISGPVGNFREETKITSQRTSINPHLNTGHTTVRTEKEVNFRIDNRPVTMKNLKGIELADGDNATVVGSDTRSGIKAILIRNDTINMIYGYSTWYLMMWAIILTAGRRRDNQYFDRRHSVADGSVPVLQGLPAHAGVQDDGRMTADSIKTTLLNKKNIVTSLVALGGMIVGAFVGIAVQVGVESTGEFSGPSVEALLEEQEANFHRYQFAPG